MKEFLLENWRHILWLIFCSGLVIEITPLKVNPITSILRWIGKRLNKDMDDKISKIETKVDMVQLDLHNHKVESWRRDILNFADSLSLGKCKSKEQYLYIISLHDSYEKYIEERGLINGQINSAYEYIQKKFNECMENNSFYTGK